MALFLTLVSQGSRGFWIQIKIECKELSPTGKVFSTVHTMAPRDEDISTMLNDPEAGGAIKKL